MKRTLIVVGFFVVFGLGFSPVVWTLQWSGTVTGRLSYQLTTSEFDYGVTLNALSTLDLGKGYYLHTDLSLKYQDENNFRPFRLNELYFQGSGVPWNAVDFKLGFLEITWGASDVLSPVDVLNPRPFSLSLEAESFQDKIPVPALNVEWYFSDVWSMEFFYQPYFVPNFVPSFVKERMVLGSLSSSLPLDPEKTVVNMAEDLPGVRFLSPIWAIRTRGSVGAFDLALSFQRGYYLSSFPYRIEFAEKDDGSAVVDVWSAYPQRSILGFEFQGTIENLEGVTVRGDLALIFPEQWMQTIAVNGSPVSMVSVLDKPYWKASLGFDYTRGNFYVNLNYLLGNPFEEGGNVSPYLYLVTNWQSEDGKWKPFWNSVLSLHDGSTVNIVGVEYKPKANWVTTLSYSFSGGARGSRLGDISDGIFLSVKYSF